MASRRYKLDDEKTGLARKLGDALYGSEVHARPGGPRTGYTGTFEQAYKNLGQGSNAPEAIVYNGTKVLTDAFIERIYEKTGQFPTAEQTRDFVSGNLTPSFAEKIIKGGISTDTIKTQLVDLHMGANVEEFPSVSEAGGVESGIEKRLGEDYEKKVGGLYDRVRESLKQDIEESYGEQKGAIARDLAGQGMLYNQPASRGVFDRLEQAKGKSTAQALASISGQQASGSVDVAKTVESLLAGERRAGEESRRFGQNYLLNKRALDESIDELGYQRGLGREALGVAERVGRAQAESKKPGTLDYVNTAFQGVNALANLWKARK